MKPVSHRTATLLLLLPPLFWAANTIVGKAVVGQIPPIALSFWRWLLAFFILLPFSLRGIAAHWGEIRREWPLLVLLSIFGVAAYSSFQYLALHSTSAINATLIGSALPIVMLPLAVFWLHERARWPAYMGVALSIAGVTTVVARGDVALLTQLHFDRGDLIMLLAVASWAFYTALLKRYRPMIPSMPLLTVQVFLGTLSILPFYLMERAQTGDFALTPDALLALAYVAVFPSVLAYYCWEKGVAGLGAQLAGLFSTLTPVFAAALAVPLLGEQFHLYHAIGLSLLVGGFWLSNRYRA
jgi:drug/metabolite transporter (DMT)-like permease